MRENDTEREREIQERDSIARTASYHRNVSELSGSCSYRYIYIYIYIYSGKLWLVQIAEVHS